MAELEGERAGLHKEVRTLRGVRTNLETEIQVKRELLHSMALTI